MSSRHSKKVIVENLQSGGEVTINLVLTIRLENGNLAIDVGNDNTAVAPKKEAFKSYDDSAKFVVPDIDVSERIDFGMKVIE